MSVDNHRHCQATVLSANGTGNQDGKSWGEINNLTLSNLPSNWKSYFTVNKNNVTQDFAATLKLIDKTVGDINSEITNIKYRLTIVEGQAGLLYDTDVTVYLAPSSDYFTSNSSIY